MIRTILLAGLSIAILAIGNKTSAVENRKIEVTILAGKLSRAETPVCVEMALPAALASGLVELQDADGNSIAAQLTPPGLRTAQSPAPGSSDSQTRELHFILPKLAAGATLQLKGTLTSEHVTLTHPEGFYWQDEPKDHIRLWFNNRPVMDYMDAPYDNSTPALRDKTLKVYDHLYDPVDGKRLVTKGPGGRYTHHRGLFYGFQKVSYGENQSTKVNIWECPNAHQSHEGVLSSEGGPVLGRQLLAIDWHGPEKASEAPGPVFAHEKREMTVYHVAGGTMVDFVSLLMTADLGPVRLDGDPQHAGFQFRAAEEVNDKTSKQTIYIRPDSVGKPGETRNWDRNSKKRDLDCVNQPWKGMSFVLGDQRYTAALLDRPDNPKEARSSERDYGRFGSYFEYNLTKDRPLLIHYRFWLQRGEATQQQIAAMDDDFVEPVKAVVQIQ